MKFKHIAPLFLIMISMAWGCSQSSPKGSDDSSSEPTLTKEKIPAPPQNVILPTATDATDGANVTGEADDYGRTPGDEHYGHGHAPNENQPATQPGSPVAIPSGTPTDAAAPQFGEVDKYGRAPGHEHYGHDHE